MNAFYIKNFCSLLPINNNISTIFRREEQHTLSRAKRNEYHKIIQQNRKHERVGKREARRISFRILYIGKRFITSITRETVSENFII